MRFDFFNLLPLLMIPKVFGFSFNAPKKYIGYKQIRQTFKDFYIDNQDYTLEHVVPQSLFKENKKLKNDMHNLIWYPPKINSHRSNFKYESDIKFDENSMLLDEEGKELIYSNPIGDNGISIKRKKKRLFIPNKIYRGEISRACMYFLTTYPEYKDMILEKVIDPYTILTWHHEYPVSETEYNKELIVKESQGNNNDFIKNPAILVPVMEDILSKKLDFFKNYDYKIEM